MSRVVSISLFGLLLLAGGVLYEKCCVDQNINFLAPGPSSWIVYPSPPRVPPLQGMPMTTVFRRAFDCPARPVDATLLWRCFKLGRLNLNGKLLADPSSAHWKNTARLDVASYLRAGTNEIEVRVTCDNGFPALNLELAGADFVLRSDETWESSLAGAEWRPAQMADRPVAPSLGNWLYGAEDIQGAFLRTWPLLVIFVALAALAVAAQRHGGTLRLGLCLTAMAWALLLLHNLPLVPAMSGFDASAHLAYIDFIQQHKALPLANQGWEYFQAPLYYIIGAGFLGLFHLRALQPEGGQVLGLLNVLMGAAELALIMVSLRRLFPGRRRLQIAGLLLGAFLPAQLYLLQYPTNETLTAVMTTAAFCLCLEILGRENPHSLWYAALGVVLGAALLSKASAVIALPAFFFALAAKAWREKRALAVFLRQSGLCLGLCLLLGGWHYWSLWRQFGNPLAGNWAPAVAGPWWQQPGYRTPAYYFTFGHALVQPLFSGFHSFWDCLYSTWWGDGFVGGATRLYGRPPWNYDLMTVGFVLALLPSALFLTGLWLALKEGIRRRRCEWLLLSAAVLMFGFAILAMSLKLPSYSQAKAFYGLPTVLPFCAIIALGLEFWAARCGRARFCLLVGLGVWLLTVYASFWIRPNAVQTRLAGAVGLYAVAGQDPGPSFENVLAQDRNNPVAIASLADLDEKARHLSRAVARLEAAPQTKTNAMMGAMLARFLGEQGRIAEAMAWARRACASSSDNPAAPAVLCSLALRAGENEQAEKAGRAALRIDPQDYDVQFSVGLALVRMQRYEEAASYFSNALNCSPQSADAHFWLGIVLWNMPGRKTEARDQVAAAVVLSPQNARWKSTLEEMQRGLATP